MIRMAEEKKSYFNIPKLDFSGFRRQRTDAEIDAICDEIERKSDAFDFREFVDRMERHPEALTAWDMSISFDEFARRVKAGEYD